MSFFAVKRSLSHPQRAKFVAYLADMQGVTPEHFLMIVRRRREFRTARMYRRRSRKRNMAKNPQFNRGSPMLEGKALYSGEGELHALLRVVGLDQKEFCERIGVRPQQFSNWYGHPMHPWPVEFLREYGWAKNMAQYLTDHDIDPEQFKPKIPERVMPTGRYPRKAGQEPKLVNEEDYSPWKKPA